MQVDCVAPIVWVIMQNVERFGNRSDFYGFDLK